MYHSFASLPSAMSSHSLNSLSYLCKHYLLLPLTPSHCHHHHHHHHHQYHHVTTVTHYSTTTITLHPSPFPLHPYPTTHHHPITPSPHHPITPSPHHHQITITSFCLLFIRIPRGRQMRTYAPQIVRALASCSIPSSCVQLRLGTLFLLS